MGLMSILVFILAFYAFVALIVTYVGTGYIGFWPSLLGAILWPYTMLRDAVIALRHRT